ncbi:MAG: geopeptide radical SAM maturase [Nitrospirae bacterium]|nr:geopeptide radical SAM maturase [Nitrospirota bacterium]
MQLSKYCKIYKSEKTADTLILFSTKNAAIAELPESLLQRINKNKSIPDADEKLLRRLGLLAADPEKEKKRVMRYIDEVNRISRTLNIKLVMNLDCNLDCRYCFEGTRKGKFYLSKSCADDFISFVRSRVVRAEKMGCGFEDIVITFYGGEPLLSKEMIISIAQRLKALAGKSGITFSFSLMTNGTLLTKATALELKKLGLKDACFTLDGLPDNHDRYRPFKGGAGSFSIILKNMKETCDVVSIDLGGNYTRENYRHFPALLDLLMDKGLTAEKIPSLSFYPIVAESASVMPDFHEGCVSINEPWLAEAGMFLRDEILRRGYSTGRVLPSICMMEQPNNMVMNYNGDIYKCPGLIGRQEYKAGDIWKGIGDYHVSHHLDNWNNEKCLGCEYLPLCFGGCRYMKLVRDGNMDGIDCKRPYLEATLEKAVMQDIRYGQL